MSIRFDKVNSSLDIIFKYHNFVFTMVISQKKAPKILGHPTTQRDLGPAFDHDGALLLNTLPDKGKELTLLQITGEIAKLFELISTVFSKSFTNWRQKGDSYEL